MRSVMLSQWRECRMVVIMTGFISFNDSTSKSVLDLLERGQLELREFIV